MTTALPPPAVDAELCTCETPAPHEEAPHKGASRTVCLNCGLPVRIAF